MSISLLLSVVGCTGDDGEPPINEDGCVAGWEEVFLGEVPEASGDLSCFAGDTTGDQPPAACLVDVALAARTVDHQSKEPVADISVDVFFADNVNNDQASSVDLSFTSDAEGLYDGTLPACQPLAYRTKRLSGDEARPTLAQHKIFHAENPPLEFDFRSVATATVNLITSPLFFGVEIEDGKGMLFGKAIGCDYEAIADVQVLVRDANCQIPDGSLVGYTTNEFPDPGARGTTGDGFFFSMNVPPGEWTLEMYRTQGESFELIGSSAVTVEPDGVTLVDLFIGRDDGLVMPTECFCE